MSDSNKEHNRTTESVLYIWRIVANLSAGSVIALLLSFSIGYKYEKSYLSGIGAAWAIELLSFNEIILGSLTVLAPLLIGFFISMNYLYNYENGRRIIRKIEVWSSGLGILLYLITVIQGHFLPDDYQKVAYILRNLSIFALAFSVGFLVVEILASFRDQESRVDHYTFNTLVYLFFTIFFVIPSISRITAQNDLKLYNENLVKTCILSEGCSEYWYIIRPISDNFLILNIEQEDQKNFRLVSTSDVKVIP